MRVSVAIPTCMEGMIYPYPVTPEHLVDVAQQAEALGYHSVWGNDHMTTQRYVRAESAVPPNFWEILTTYGYLAAETKTIRLGTGVLVLPMRRDIVVTAKQLATLDQLSRGRLMVGLGVGAYREEFEALQPDRDVERGKVLDDGIQALQVLLRERVASWDGTYYQFRDVEMYPKPRQNPLPIYVGGNNPNAVRRAVQYGQGWMPAGMPIADMQRHMARLTQIAGEFGRDVREIDVAPQLICYIGRSHEAAVAQFQQSQMFKHLISLRTSTLREQAGANMTEVNLIGTPSEIIAKIQRLAEVGVTHVAALLFAVNTAEELIEQMQQFAADIAPHVRS